MLPKNFTPTTSNYTMQNLQTGKVTRIRCMTDFVVGRSVWGDDNKVTRVRDGEKMFAGAIGVNKNTGQPNNIKQFVACIVWNYDAKSFEVFEADKVDIVKGIFALQEDSDYGDALDYDLKIGKTGSGMKTKYTCIGAPPKKVDKEIVEAFKLESYDLDRLLFGASDNNDQKEDEENPFEDNDNKDENPL